MSFRVCPLTVYIFVYKSLIGFHNFKLKNIDYIAKFFYFYFLIYTIFSIIFLFILQALRCCVYRDSVEPEIKKNDLYYKEINNKVFEKYDLMLPV